MKKTYQFKLNLTSNQRQTVEHWLDLLRHEYNWLLAERFNWWKFNRNDVILAPADFSVGYCSIMPTELKDNPDWHSQSATLPQLKKERPWYKQIYSQVLQDCVKRVKLAFERYIQGDSNGKRAGKPRFKNRSRYKTFTFPQVKQDWLFGNQIKLPKLGVLHFIKSRDIFVEIIEQIAFKYGVKIIKVNPKNTSQLCNKCLNKVSKTLSDRWHNCPNCGESIDRDYNSALLIKKLAVGSRQYKMPKSHTLKKGRNRCSE